MEESAKSFLGVDRSYVATNGKKYKKMLRAGCGVKCQTLHGPQNVDCPSCGKFTWHVEYLKIAFAKNGNDLPDLSKEDWKCPHCRSS